MIVRNQELNSLVSKNSFCYDRFRVFFVHQILLFLPFFVSFGQTFFRL
eukprot:UN04877